MRQIKRFLLATVVIIFLYLAVYRPVRGTLDERSGYTSYQEYIEIISEKFLSTPTISFAPETDLDVMLGGKKRTIHIGAEEPVPLMRINYYPDAHTSYLTESDGTIKLWIAGDTMGYIVEAPSFDKLAGSETTEVIGPSREDGTFDEYYAAPGSVVRGTNDELLMFYHGEIHTTSDDTKTYIAGIGLATSDNGGNSWERKGQILHGRTDEPANGQPAGAGEPSAIQVDDYWYLYYVDWDPAHPVGIHVARSKLESNGEPGSWEKYFEGTFVDAEENKSTPIMIPEGLDTYAGLPSVSWNSYVKRYLMSFVGREGFYLTSSKDGIEWSVPTLIMNVQTGNDYPEQGDHWYSFPTLISPSKPTDQETDSNLWLLYSKGEHKKTSHEMVMRELFIQ